mmetsp:Transcript_682/g.2167  ORF Transcript_682/g.2167 Transcript_682/m.2167 type:complete len:294 (+) Transcript_682:331-1212(+)
MRCQTRSTSSHSLPAGRPPPRRPLLRPALPACPRALAAHWPASRCRRRLLPPARSARFAATGCLAASGCSASSTCTLGAPRLRGAPAVSFRRQRRPCCVRPRRRCASCAVAAPPEARGARRATRRASGKCSSLSSAPPPSSPSWPPPAPTRLLSRRGPKLQSATLQLPSPAAAAGWARGCARLAATRRRRSGDWSISRSSRRPLPPRSAADGTSCCPQAARPPPPPLCVPQPLPLPRRCAPQWRSCWCGWRAPPSAPTRARRSSRMSCRCRRRCVMGLAKPCARRCASRRRLC